MKQKITVCEENALERVSDVIREIYQSQGRNIVLLVGDLGAGKTALVKNYVHRYLDQTADSPTFSLVNTYQASETVFHFDLYRLTDVEEIMDIGFWDYLDSENLCFIEWPDKIAELLPAEFTTMISIKVNSKQCREFTVSY